MPGPIAPSIHAILTGLALGLAVSGCAFGPKVLYKSHEPYAAAVQRVEEEQLLRNIVRHRYVEAPSALEVASIAAQYELSTAAEARPFFSTEGVSGPDFRSFSTILPFAALSAANRPTVSLTPQDDGSVVRQFLTPISPETLVFLSQAGWPVSSILRIWVDRLNGVPNFVPASGPPRDAPADFERFLRVAELFQVAQDQELGSVHPEDRVTEVGGPLPASAITAAATLDAAKSGYEYRPDADRKTWFLIRRERHLVLFIHPTGLGSPEVAELVGLLNLVPGLVKYQVVVATGVPDPAKNPTGPTPVLRLTPRSTAQALFFLANGVEVPPEHVACGLVRLPDGLDPTAATQGLFRVHSCKGHKHKPPPCAYVAV